MHESSIFHYKIQENPGDPFKNFAASTRLNSWNSNMCGLEHNAARLF